MWNSGFYHSNITNKKSKKLSDAWEKFYTPMQLSQDKFRIKVKMRVQKGKFPKILN